MRSLLIISRVVAAVFNRGQLKSGFATLSCAGGDNYEL